ncbi:MAG: stage V sporulation protein SpoVM [Clostridia bacterium]
MAGGTYNIISNCAGGGSNMKIVVVKVPKFLGKILRKIFRIKR